MKHFAFTIAFVVAWATLAGSGLAADGWNLLAWNPFDRDIEEPRASARVTDTGASIGASRAAARPVARRAQDPSVWTKMNRGTKSFFAKTKDAINPWDDEPQRSRSTGTRYRSRSHQDDRNQSFLGSLFNPEPEPKRIETVKDWLDQPRPHP